MSSKEIPNSFLLVKFVTISIIKYITFLHFYFRESFLGVHSVWTLLLLLWMRLCKAQRKSRVIIFPVIPSHFSLVRNRTNIFILYKGSFLVLLFFYYTLMTFLMILSVILLSVLMITLYCKYIRHLWSVATTRIGFSTWIWSTTHCGLGQEVACWFNCWKNNWCHLTGLITLVLLMWK